MPKEYISKNPGDNAVEITWGRESYVQIATVNTNQPTLSEVRGWYADLDREGCNRLIRALRKARDQAYGCGPCGCCVGVGFAVVERGCDTEEGSSLSGRHR